MTKLSVNVNKLATLRNSRGKNNPDVAARSREIVAFGAQGITVHPRPDERHIRKSDVYELKDVTRELGVEFNIEGYPADDFVDMVLEVKPEQVTLVPDPPHVITSNAGWNVSENQTLLRDVSSRFEKHGIRVSVFVDPETMLETEYTLLRNLGVHRIELFTEKFAECWGTPDGEAVLQAYRKAAELARSSGLGVNAGHDLSLDNLQALARGIPWMDEVSIGHALICDALTFGLEATVKKYLGCLTADESEVLSTPAGGAR